MAALSLAILFPTVTLIGFVNDEASRAALRKGGQFIASGRSRAAHEMFQLGRLDVDELRRALRRSDEVEKPAAEQSDAWKARAAVHLDCEISAGSPLVGHF